MKCDPLSEGMSFEVLENPERIPDMLRAAAKEFLLAGGVLMLGDWSRLSEESKTAFTQAADELRQEEADSMPWAGGEQ